MAPTRAMEQFNSLSDNNQKLVINLIEHLSNKPQKKKKDFLGLLSLHFDWLCPKSTLNDDEVDEIIASVRKERNAANSH